MEPLDDQIMGSEDLTHEAKVALLGTRPWMMFMVILGFVYVAFMVIVTIIGFSMGDGSGASNLFGVAISGYLYWLLFKTAQKIKQFSLDSSPNTLEEALLNYRNYWLVTGILILIVLAIMALALVIGLIAAIAFI